MERADYIAKGCEGLKARVLLVKPKTVPKEK